MPGTTENVPHRTGLDENASFSSLSHTFRLIRQYISVLYSSIRVVSNLNFQPAKIRMGSARLNPKMHYRRPRKIMFITIFLLSFSPSLALK